MDGKKLAVPGSASVSQGQIQAVGDAAFTWLEDRLGQGWLATTLVDPLIEKIRGSWDAQGVPFVASLMSDLGWTVTADPAPPTV